MNSTLSSHCAQSMLTRLVSSAMSRNLSSTRARWPAAARCSSVVNVG